MGNPEVIILALKDFEVAGMNYVAGNKYALSPEVIATLEDGTVEIVVPETVAEVVEETPAPEVAPEEVNQVSPEVTPEEIQAVPETPMQPQAPEETPVPTPEAEAPAETVEEPKPWAGNHTVAS